MKLYHVQAPAEAIQRGSLSAGWHAPSTDQEISAQFYLTPEKRHTYTTIQHLSEGDQVLVSDSAIENAIALALATVTENLTGNRCALSFLKGHDGTPLWIPVSTFPEVVVELVTTPQSQPLDAESLSTELDHLYENYDATEKFDPVLESQVTSSFTPNTDDSSQFSTEPQPEAAPVAASIITPIIELTGESRPTCTQRNSTGIDAQEEVQALQKLAVALGIPIEPIRQESNMFSIMGLKTDLQIHLHMLIWLCDQDGSHGLGNSFSEQWITTLQTDLSTSMPPSLTRLETSLQVTAAEDSSDSAIVLSSTIHNEQVTLTLDAALCSTLSDALDSLTAASPIADAEAQFLLSNYRRFLTSKCAQANQATEIAHAIYNEHPEALDALFHLVHNKSKK